MINIIFGDDIKTSRNFYFQKKNEFPNSYVFDGKNMNSSEAFQILKGSSLFVEGPIFIENFFSNIKSSDNQEVLSYLIENEREAEVFIWEEATPPKTVLNNFKKPNLLSFALPKTIFAFLDSIRPNNDKVNISSFRDALMGSDPEVLFYMLIRQFRLLIAVSDLVNENIDEIAKLASWQKDKLERQARIFGKEKLISEYRKLYEIDYSQKTGQSAHTLTQAIDFFLIDL